MTPSMADRDVDIVCSTRVKQIAKWYKVCLNTFFSGVDSNCSKERTNTVP